MTGASEIGTSIATRLPSHGNSSGRTAPSLSRWIALLVNSKLESIQSLKLDMAAGSFQRFYPKEENIVYGGELVQVTVRAKLLSAASGVTMYAEMLQNSSTGRPEPFESGLAIAGSAEGASTLTTSWGTYVFTMPAANAKPRAIVNINVVTGANAAIVLIDRVKINKGSGKNVGPLVMFKADRTGNATAIPVGPVPFSSVVFNEGNAAWDGTVYTIPVSGYYEVTGQFKSNNSGAYAAGLGLQKSTDGGTTWTQIAYSPNNAANSFGGSYLEDTEYFTAGVKLRLNLNGAGLTPS
jgi:hypothetical protein